MSEIQVIDNLKAAEVFDGKSLQPLLDKLRDDVKSLVIDVCDAKGRKEIASIAARISKSKVYLDNLGKDMVDDWKKQAKVIDTQRKIMRDFLDELKMEFRAPLTEWERNEHDRVAKHEASIFEIRERGKFCSTQWNELSLERLQTELERTESVQPDQYEEFEHDITVTKFESIQLIRAAIESRENYDAEQKELNELRALKQEAERAKAEQLAADKARNEESQKAEAERERLEQEKAQAEKRAAEAEQSAREELEANQAAEKAEAERRAADTKHRGKINRQAMDAFKALGMSQADAKKVVTAIAKQMIPNVEIKY